jgi:peptidylprolyl isomerase
MTRMMRHVGLATLLIVGIAGCSGGNDLTIPADAQKTPSGISSKVLTPGTGTAHPTPASQVLVHYTGWTMDGKEFDSSVKRGQPIDFYLHEVIPGWTEGVGLMVKGEKRRLWIPGNLAYDNSPRPDAPRGMLVFDIELLDFK